MKAEASLRVRQCSRVVSKGAAVFRIYGVVEGNGARLSQPGKSHYKIERAL